MEVTAIQVSNLSKNYSLSKSQLGRLRHLFANGNGGRGGLWALREVSFSVARGEAFGIIGANGSGKSTLLQIIAGILRPTSGSVQVNGRLSALLELGSGFSPEFTGRDNVYMNASVLGLSHEEIDRRFEDIERFAGIGPFMNQPIRTYSTGMVLRLAFAVAAHVDAEILIVDEALAVGDIAFRQRCMRRIHELRSQGVTILFVSHETSDVKALCERCLWLQNGMIQQMGESDSVVGKYLSATLQRENALVASPGPQTAAVSFETAFRGHRYGDGRATILGGALINAAGDPGCLLKPLDHVAVRIRFRVNAPLDSPIAGFLVRNSKGENIFGTNTARENYPVPSLESGCVHTVEFRWETPRITSGSYSISLGIANGDLGHYSMCDYIEDALPMRIETAGSGRGYFELPCTSVRVHWNQ